MRRLIPIALIVLMAVVSLGFRGTGWRGDVHKAELSDTADVVRGEIRDTATAVVVDTATIFRAEMTDSAEDVWNDSASVMRGNINDTADILRAEMVDTAEVYGAIGALGDSMAAFRQTAQTITATWEWDGGNIIAADGQKLILTADDEGDSASIYVGDSLHITADVPIRLGGAGLTKIMDSLAIPTYAAFPATGSEGLFAADSANDSLIAYWGAARRVIYPQGAGTFRVQLITTSTCLSDQATGTTNFYSGGINGIDADSIIVDSLYIYYDTSDNDTYIDSIALLIGYAKSGKSSTILWADGTNRMEGTATDLQISATGLSFKSATDTRLHIFLSTATAGTEGYSYVWSFILYCRKV